MNISILLLLFRAYLLFEVTNKSNIKPPKCQVAAAPNLAGGFTRSLIQLAHSFNRSAPKGDRPAQRQQKFWNDRSPGGKKAKMKEWQL